VCCDSRADLVNVPYRFVCRVTEKMKYKGIRKATIKKTTKESGSESDSKFGCLIQNHFCIYRKIRIEP